MRYINPIDSKIAFERLLRSPYFVDKTGLIVRIAPLIDAEQSFVCITRPRRFGKTVNARMLACFLSRGLESSGLFEGLEAASQPQVMAHLQGHDAIYIDFSSLPQDCGGYPDYIGHIAGGLIEDLCRFAPLADIPEDETDVAAALGRAFSAEGKRFCFVIDEWDSMFFNPLFSEKDQRAFLMFLKQLLRSRAYVELAYMTGILPIAKHSTGSEPNVFAEYSAIDDPRYERFFGFTEDEVRTLCERDGADRSERMGLAGQAHRKVLFDDLKRWYDGYAASDGASMFNPRSVVMALSDGCLRSYWAASGPCDEIYCYVKNNIAEVREDLVRMVAGESVPADMKGYAALVDLVYLAAWDHCQVRREEPADKGVADVAFIPLNAADARWVPFVIELKAGGSVQDAIAQIRSRDYLALFKDSLVGEGPSAIPLAVGIAWDPAAKTHECAVEPLQEEIG